MDLNLKEKRARDRKREEEDGGFFSKFLAFFLGLFIGIVIPIAAVVGVAYVVYTKPANEAANTIDGTGDLYNTIFNSENGFINPYYSDKLVSELLNDTATAVMALSENGSLESIAKISTHVSNAVDDLVEQIGSFGIKLTRAEVLAKPLEELLPFIGDSIQNAPLGDVLQSYSEEELDDPVLLCICYGSDLHYTEIEENDEIRYEMKQITYVYKDYDLTDTDTTKKLYDISGIIINETFNEAEQTLTFEDGTVYYLELQTDGEPDTYLAFEDQERKIPVTYPYTTLGTLLDSIDNLAIIEIYRNEIFEADGTTPKSVWKYLLNSGEGGVPFGSYKDAEDENKIKPYTINDMNALIDNMTKNVQNVSLSQLVADKMLTVEDTDSLSTELPATVEGVYARPDGKTKLGDLNINELFTLVNYTLLKIKE